MSLGSPGIQLKETKQCKLKLDKCVLCQNVKDKQGNKKLTSTENGRKTLIECSKILKDGLFCGIQDEKNIKYHVNTCYPK